MIRGLILSLQFLTRIPINIPVDFNRENLKKSFFFYPYVGILLGFIGYINYSVFFKFNQNLAAFFSLLSLILLTGGLHLDGLADSCDGFFSSRSKEETLRIMEDSHIGSFGVLGLISIFFLKYILIKSLDRKLLLGLTISLGNSRLVQTYNIAFKKMAKDDGLAALFKKSISKWGVVISIFIYFLLLLYLDPLFIISLLVSFIFNEILVGYSYNKIGGITGDVLGASIELIEAVSLIYFLGVIE